MTVLCSLQSRAQYITIGPEVGVNFNTFRVDDDYYDNDYDMKPGLKIGGIVDVGFTPMVSFQPGLFYTMKGARERYVEAYAPGVNNHVQNDVRINYLEIPLNLQLKLGHPSRSQFFIGAGPYIAFAMGGEVEYESVLRTQNGQLVDRERDDYELELGNRTGEDDYKGTDAGLNLNMGIMGRRGFFVRGNMGLGLANIIPGGDETYSVRNFGLGLSIGFLFGP
jgi:hypothetical protein